MKIKTINLFTFDELTPDAQKKAIEGLRNINVEFNDWYDGDIENAKQTLSEKGFPDATIYFSGFNSQGDGASFNAGIDLSKFTTDKRIIAIAEAYCDFRIEKTSFANHYSHEKTRYVDYNALDEKFVRINAALEELSANIESERLSLSRDIYSDLSKSFDYLTSDAAVIETIKANEYHFTESGKLENL